jgi:predicted PurR-regulated permease PerM
VLALVIGYEIAGIVGMVIAVPTAELIAERKVEFAGAER